MLTTRTKEDILIAAIERLEQYAKNKFDFTSTSTVRLMLEVIAEEIASISDIAASSVLNKTLDTATGTELDLFGAIFGISRLSSTNATDLTYSTIKFYIDPAFGYTTQNLINKIPAAVTAATIDKVSGTIQILSGITLKTNITGVTFTTTTDVTLQSTDTYGFVNGTATASGSTGNISTGAIISHNISNIQPELEDIADYILVTNVSPIMSGSDEETDDNYRARLVNAIRSNASANEVAIRMMALSVPGVSDVNIIKYINGLGTTGVEIVGTEPIVNVGTLRAVYNACSQVVACGETIEVIQPEYSIYKCTISALTDSGSINDSVKNTIKKGVIDYIINIPKGGVVYLSKIIAIAQNADPSVKSVDVTHLWVGELDILSGSSMNLYPLAPTNVGTSTYEKWYTDASYVEVVDA